MIQTNPSKQTFFSHLGIIFTLLLFSFAAQAQVAINSLCGITLNSTPYAGTSSIYQLDLNIPGAHHCGDIGFYLNGTLLDCSSTLQSSVSGFNCQAYNGMFNYGNGGTAELVNLYLDTRAEPYTLSSTPPTDNSITVIQNPENLVTVGSAVTFTAEALILDGSTTTVSGYKWFRNGVEIPGQISATLTEVPPRNGTTYTVEAQLSDGTTMQSEEKLVLLTSAIDGRFSMSGNASSITIMALDECSSIYEVDFEVTNAYHSEFVITENGVPLSSSSVLTVNGVPNVNWNNNGDKLFYNAGPAGAHIKCYLNTRTTPYELAPTYNQWIDPSYIKLTLSANKNVINAAGDPVNLTAVACPTGATYTYEWYENGVLMPGKSGSAITVNPDKNGNEYTVKVNGIESNEELILFSDACDNRFSTVNWYESATILEACAVDECHAVYKLTLSANKDAHFQIALDGSPIDASSFSAHLSNESNDDGDPGYRASNAGTFTCYLDMRTNGSSFTLTDDKPARSVLFVFATVVGGSQIERCTPITITTCPADPTFTYQWYKNGVIMPGETAATLTDDISAENASGFEYHVEATTPSGTIISNIIIITYKPDLELPGTTSLTGYSEKLNYYEHSVKTGDKITISESVVSAAMQYTLQYKSLEVGSQWRDSIEITPVIGSGISYTLEPQFGAKYRIKGVEPAVNACKAYYSDSVLVRFIYSCDGGDSWDLFKEDFGSFSAGEYFYGNGQSTTTNVHEMNYPSGSYWAKDPTNRVKGHSFAWEEGGVYTWCSMNDGRRIQDKYYAIVNNPASGDCGNYDYWNGGDHTGNTNGAMLFVNVKGDGEGQVVYEQEIKIEGGCKDVKVLFSAFINNATIKGQTPVDVRLDVLNADKTKVLYSISSGEVVTRTQATASSSWANLSFKFDVEEGASYWLHLTNNASGGASNNSADAGNDILIDDISVTICVPKIELNLQNTAIKNFGTGNIIGVCEDDVTAKFSADLPSGSGLITDLFTTPVYQYQYSRDGGITWQDFTTTGQIVDVDLIYDDDVFRGITHWRVIVAGSQTTIDKVTSGAVTEPSCSNMYLISNILIVNFDHQKFNDVDINECYGVTYEFEADIPHNGSYKWYDADASGAIEGNELQSGAYSSAQPKATIQIPTPTNTTPKKYVFRAVSENDCPFDYVVTIIGRDCDDLVLEKSASAAEIDAGDELQYTITVSNKSLFGTRNITVYDKLPATMSYRSHTITPSSAGTYSKETGEWNIARLETNDEATLTITVRNIGGADSDIINYAFIKNRTKEAVPEETDSYSDYEDAKANKPAFADTAKVYVTPTEIPGILGNQPCKDDVITYSLNEDIVPLKPNLEYKWSILPVGQTGAYIQGSSTDATFEVKYYQAPAEYEIVCVVVDPDLTDPPITQTKKVYVTDVPNVTITGKMDVCYGDIEKYSALSDNTPYGDYKWTLSSDENELIIKGAHSQTSTVEWLPSNGAPTFDVVQVELTNTSAWASCSNSAMLPVTIHPNPLIDFSYDGSSTKYFESEPAYRHTDSIYANVPVKFINESHTLGSVNGVEFYWDYAGDGVFSQASYDGENTYHYPGDYMVQLLAIDNTWGCKTIIEKPLEVLPNPNCIASFPNAFTPTQESNKVFGALYTNGVLYEGFELRVYDRWGTMLWSTNDPYEYWDGTYRGEMGKQDVYVYHCKAVCEAIDPATGNRKSLSIKGDVTLIR